MQSDAEQEDQPILSQINKNHSREINQSLPRKIFGFLSRYIGTTFRRSCYKNIHEWMLTTFCRFLTAMSVDVWTMLTPCFSTGPLIGSVNNSSIIRCNITRVVLAVVRRHRLDALPVRCQEAAKPVADDHRLPVGAWSAKSVEFPLYTVRYQTTECLEERIVAQEHRQLGTRVDERRHFVNWLVLASFDTPFWKGVILVWIAVKLHLYCRCKNTPLRE